MLIVPFAFWFGFLNCARGRLLFNTTTSTEIARMVSTFGMGLAIYVITFNPVICVFAWGALLLWCTPAWDSLWGAEIGYQSTHSRLWGLGMMTLRMLLALPCLLGLAFALKHSPLPAAGVLTLGLPYYIAGYVLPTSYAVQVAEFFVGLILGALVFLIII